MGFFVLHSQTQRWDVWLSGRDLENMASTINSKKSLSFARIQYPVRLRSVS